MILPTYLKKIIITFLIIIGFVFFNVLSISYAQNEENDQALEDELAYLRAENYMYSASKKMQKIHDIAAAVFVITKDDIRRSTATNIPELLRMVPGIQVAQVDANKWAISARGSNARFSTHLLVMIDGRSIYTPVFSGVFWHREDTPLEDIERIEIIRGAGAAMWGANAVSGVINILTKNAKNTQGYLINVGYGNQEKGFIHARYGDKIGDNFYYRLYGKAFQRDSNILRLSKQNAKDNWSHYQSGFKSEWLPNLTDKIVTQGEIYYSQTSNREYFAAIMPVFTRYDYLTISNHKGGNLQTRWQHQFADKSESALQVYYKYDTANWDFVTPFIITEQTLDIDFQHRDFLIPDHETIWGIGYRHFDFNTTQSVKLAFNPTHQQLQTISGFIRDDWQINSQLKLTLGARIEQNSFTGIEIQPNLRLLWQWDHQQSLWLAISRAVRAPSLSTRSLDNLTNPILSNSSSNLPMISVLDGNSQFKSETVLETEIGYRLQLNKKFSFDINFFYDHYNRLQANQILAPQLTNNNGLFIQIPIEITNKAWGNKWGMEISSQWQPKDWLKIQMAYWLLKQQLQMPSELKFTTSGGLLNQDSPQQQYHLRLGLNLPYHFELDTLFRYVDSVKYAKTPAYQTLDLRLAWKYKPNIEFVVIGQNILDNHHPEYTESISSIPQTEIQRSIFGKFSWTF
ncbi:MAG: hypothetical protein RL637_1179 [Pseudomonadota bacterium]|jgi:iron complex outermembrane receptor protein